MGVDHYLKDCVVDRRDRTKGNLWMFEGSKKCKDALGASDIAGKTDKYRQRGLSMPDPMCGADVYKYCILELKLHKR